jgi:hypothetical protein
MPGIRAGTIDARGAWWGMSRSSGLRGTAHLCNCGVQTRGRGVFFEIANQGYLPALIPRADLVEGNSKLEVSRSVAQVAGPAIAGLLLPAARAILIDAASIRVVLSNPTPWKISGCTATANPGSNVVFAVYLILVFRYLHLSQGVMGLIFAWAVRLRQWPVGAIT